MTETAVQFYLNSSDAWGVMLDDIRAAKHSISIEQYIFNADMVGIKFIDLLLEKAREGVSVRLICDMAGSLAFYNSFYPEFLKKQGIEIRFFNPIPLWRIFNITTNLFRDHRKIMIIDDAVSHMGGVGIEENMRLWRDTHMRITGSLTDQVKQTFETVWEEVRMGFYIKYAPPAALQDYAVLVNAPSLRQRYIHQELISRIKKAKRLVYLATPYFIPDVRLYRALRAAAKRRVDVRIMVPEIADHIFINHARESYFTLALRAGIKIFVYMPVMMHAKTAVIDDWATAGSFNLDSLSFNFNHEANVVSCVPAFVQELKTHFIQDMKSCREVVYKDWIRRPLRKKILELLTWPFHGVM